MSCKRKLTEEEKLLISEKWDNKISVYQIAKDLKVSPSTVFYILNPDKRKIRNEKAKIRAKENYKLGKAWGLRHPEEQRALMRKINNKRYEDDPVFREKQKKNMRLYSRKRYNEGTSWQKQNPEKYRDYIRKYMRERRDRKKSLLTQSVEGVSLI